MTEKYSTAMCYWKLGRGRHLAGWVEDQVDCGAKLGGNTSPKVQKYPETGETTKSLEYDAR